MIVVYFNKLGHAKVFEPGHLREITLRSVQSCPCELAPQTGLFFFFCICPLQMVVVDPRKRLYLGNGKYSIHTSHLLDTSRGGLKTKLLKSSLPNGAQLLFIDQKLIVQPRFSFLKNRKLSKNGADSSSSLVIAHQNDILIVLGGNMVIKAYALFERDNLHLIQNGSTEYTKIIKL